MKKDIFRKIKIGSSFYKIEDGECYVFIKIEKLYTQKRGLLNAVNEKGILVYFEDSVMVWG